MKDLILPGGVIFSDKDLEGLPPELKYMKDTDWEEVVEIIRPELEQTIQLINEYKKAHPEEKF